MLSVWKALHAVLLEHARTQLLWGRNSAEHKRSCRPQPQKCGPQSHYRHRTAVDKRDRGSCTITGRSISHQWALGPPPPAKSEPAGTSPSSYRAGSGLHTQLQLWLRSHTCVSLTSALPNNSEVLLGTGKLLKTEREKCQVPQGVTGWAGSWP